MTIPLFDGFCSQNPIQIVRPQHLVNRNFSFVLSSLTYIHLIMYQALSCLKKILPALSVIQRLLPFRG